MTMGIKSIKYLFFIVLFFLMNVYVWTYQIVSSVFFATSLTFLRNLVLTKIIFNIRRFKLCANKIVLNIPCALRKSTEGIYVTHHHNLTIDNHKEWFLTTVRSVREWFVRTFEKKIPMNICPQLLRFWDTIWYFKVNIEKKKFATDLFCSFLFFILNNYKKNYTLLYCITILLL